MFNTKTSLLLASPNQCQDFYKPVTGHVTVGQNLN